MRNEKYTRTMVRLKTKLDAVGGNGGLLRQHEKERERPMKRGLVMLLCICMAALLLCGCGRVRHPHRRDCLYRAAKTQDRKRMKLCRRKRGNFRAGRIFKEIFVLALSRTAGVADKKDR